MASIPEKQKTQPNEVNQDHSSGSNDITPIATNIANILSKHYSVVQKQTQIYYGLRLKGGSDYHKLEKDAGNDAWKFFHKMLLHYFDSCIDTRKAINEIIACLRNLDLEFCASQVEMLDSPTGLVRSQNDIFWHNMDDICSNFVGREKELGMIEENLHKQNRTTEYTVLTSISGMGGIGKTTLARKFANYFCKVYNGSVAWIPAENVSLVSNEFTKIGNQLNIRSGPSAREFSKSIYETLLSKNVNVLFIFDNLDDLITEWIYEFLPRGLAQKRPFILITSRRRDILTDRSNVVDLDVLSLKDALEMIKQVLPNISSKVGHKLAETLQFYPLALQIAIAEIGSVTSLSHDEATEKYIQEFDTNHAILLDKNENKLLDYKFTSSASLTITLTKLATLENGNLLLSLLRLISIIYPDEIQEEFISEIFLSETSQSLIKNFLKLIGVLKQNEPIPISKLLELLCKYSILSVVSHGAKVYKVHRMIQYATHQTSNTEQMKNAVQVLLTWFESKSQSKFLYRNLNHVEFGMKWLYQNKSLYELEWYYDKLKSIVYTYAAWRTVIPGELMRSFMTKHFQNDSEVTCVDYIRSVHFKYFEDVKKSKAYIFLKEKYEILLPQMDPLIVAVRFLRDNFTSKVSKENLTLLQEMFSVSVDDIMHKFQPLMNEKVVHIVRDPQESCIYVYIEELFRVFLLHDNDTKDKMYLKSIDQLKKVSKYAITNKFGLFGPLRLINSTVKRGLTTWFESILNKLIDMENTFAIFEKYYNGFNLTYNELYEILFFGSPLYDDQPLRTTTFCLRLYNSIAMLTNGISIILDLTNQDWNNLLYGYDWLFTSAEQPFLQETEELVNRVNTQISQAELKDVKIYSLLAYLQKKHVPSELISWFEFPVNFENRISNLGLGIFLSGKFYMDPLVSIVYAKSCDNSLQILVYKKIVEPVFHEKFFSYRDLMFELCFLLHEICLSNLTQSLLTVPLTLLLTGWATEEGDKKLLDLFMKSLESNEVEEKTHVVRLKDELQQCFNILEINTGDFESDCKHLLRNLRSKMLYTYLKPNITTMEKSNGESVFIKDHKTLENFISKVWV